MQSARRANVEGEIGCGSTRPWPRREHLGRARNRNAHLRRDGRCALDFFFDSADSAYRAITGGVVKNGAKLDFSGFQAGEIAVLIENFSATVAKVIMNLSWNTFEEVSHFGIAEFVTEVEL